MVRSRGNAERATHVAGPCLASSRKRQLASHTYDELGRPNLNTWHGGTTTTYDAGDRPTQITDSVGGTITRTCENGARRFSGGSRSAGT